MTNSRGQVTIGAWSAQCKTTLTILGKWVNSGNGSWSAGCAVSSQLDPFTSRLPHRPYCTDDLTTGVWPRGREQAVRQRYIQPYPPAMVGCLVFDVDRQGAAFAWETGNLPAPSIVATNPANGHAHLFYAVETPVIKTDAARMEPVRFLAAARCLFTEHPPQEPSGRGRGLNLMLEQSGLAPQFFAAATAEPASAEHPSRAA